MGSSEPSIRRRVAARQTVVAAILLLCGCGGTTTPAGEEIAPRFADRAAFHRFVAEGWDSPFGLDYVFVHSSGARDRQLVDGVCRDVAIRWVNLARLDWKVIEKSAPRNGRHSYNWSDLDEAVRTWQRNGIHILISMRFESPWATADKNDQEFVYLKGIAKTFALAGADYLPKPEHMQDLRDYVSNLVERYDGDGQNDMPGLLFPIVHYQAGNEYSNEVFWTGTADQYGLLLRQFSLAARGACPQVKVVLSGIGFREIYGFYDLELDAVTQAYVRQQLPRVPAGMNKFVERTEAFSIATARFTDAYDILDARWPNYGIVKKSAELLHAVRGRGKEIWSAEIYSGFPLLEPLVLPNWTLHAWPTPSRSTEYISILKNPKHPQFDRVNQWYRGLQAAQVVKICMVALDAGSRKLMMGWAVDIQNPLAVSTLSHHGLYSATFKHLWPAAYTYNLTITKLEGLQSVRRIRMPDNVFVYHCQLEQDRQVLVAFYDDHIGQNHDEPMGEIEMRIPVSAQEVQITEIISRVGQIQPRVRSATVENGRLALRLTEYPVFIEPRMQ